MTLCNHPSVYRYPLYLITDKDYNALGAVEITEEGRYVGRDTTGAVIFDRKARPEDAARKNGRRMVSTSWYGVPAGRPCDPPSREHL